MLRLTLRALTTLAVSALAASVLVFVMLRLLGGDVATVILGESATPESLARVREELGLNAPLIDQYRDWLVGFVTGDLGTSYASRTDIAHEIWTRLAVTMPLAFGALFIAAIVAVPAGTYSAINARRKRGFVVDVASQVGMAIPSFWGGLLLVLLFSVSWDLLPAGNFVAWTDSPVGAIKSLILPTVALAVPRAATLTRYVRSSMLDVLSEDYVRTAMATGRTLGRSAIVHGLKNAAIPLVTVVTLQFGGLLVGAVVVENVFALPGIGRLFVTSVQSREVVVVQSLALVIVLFVLVLNFVMDVTYGFLDPRIRDRAAAGATA